MTEEDGAMSDVRAAGAETRGQGICRTCLAPIWNEGGKIGGRRRAEGWSDRVIPGGDDLVCFKAVEYRHVPLTGREAVIYDHAYELGAREGAGAVSGSDQTDSLTCCCEGGM